MRSKSNRRQRCSAPFTVLLQPVESIYDIPAARRLAVLCDGMLILLDKESLEGQAVPGLKVSYLEAIQAVDLMGYSMGGAYGQSSAAIRSHIVAALSLYCMSDSKATIP